MRFLAVGRLVGMKGFAYLVEACALLKARCAAEFLLEIIGDGDQRASLEAAIDAHALQGTVVCWVNGIRASFKRRCWLRMHLCSHVCRRQAA